MPVSKRLDQCFIERVSLADMWHNRFMDDIDGDQQIFQWQFCIHMGS